MTTTKTELRGIVVDILLNRSHQIPAHQFIDLELAVANELRIKQGTPALPQEINTGFTGVNWLLYSEVFHDLIIDKIITPGWDNANPKLPWFRLHSEARENQRKLVQVPK